MNNFAPESPQDDVTRALPHALGPEKSVLSCCLMDPNEFMPRAVEAGLSAAHFYLPSHATLWEFLVRQFNEGVPIELVSLIQRLLDVGLLDRCGGPATVTDIYAYSMGTHHFDQHLQFLRNKLVARSLIQVSSETIASVYDSPDETAKILDETEEKIMAIRAAGAMVTEEPLPATVMRVAGHIIEIIEHKKAAAGMSTGFNGIDDLGAFLKPGEVFVVAARPSMGKTAFLMNIAESVCVDRQMSTLIFSAEMTKDSLLQRAICSRAKFAISEVQKGAVTPTKGDLERLKRAGFEWASAPLTINDKAQIGISELRAVARRVHRKRPLKLIGIDYLQYLRSFSKQSAGSREREIAEISAGIKALAKELQVAIVLLAQLNRGPESRTGKNLGVPRMSDLRESGAIEQDADVIGLLYREDYYVMSEDEKAELSGQSKLILAKNRNGETGNVPLTFIAPFVRFEDGPPANEMNYSAQPKSRYED